MGIKFRSLRLNHCYRNIGTVRCDSFQIRQQIIKRKSLPEFTFSFPQSGYMPVFDNELKHTAGVLSMARAMHPDSAGSQFFIMHKDAPHLDGAYAAFGKIIEGMDVVNHIAETPVDYSDRPMTPQVMKKVTVDTFGVEYPEPEEC